MKLCSANVPRPRCATCAVAGHLAVGTGGCVRHALVYSLRLVSSTCGGFELHERCAACCGGLRSRGASIRMRWRVCVHFVYAMLSGDGDGVRTQRSKGRLSVRCTCGSSFCITCGGGGGRPNIDARACFIAMADASASYATPCTVGGDARLNGCTMITMRYCGNDELPMTLYVDGEPRRGDSSAGKKRERGSGVLAVLAACAKSSTIGAHTGLHVGSRSCTISVDYLLLRPPSTGKNIDAASGADGLRCSSLSLNVDRLHQSIRDRIA